MQKIYITSLGCDKNRVDGETMIGVLRLTGYEVVNDPAAASAIIVNTCGFIRDAVQESIDLILELSEYKTSGECTALVVVGCMAQRYKAEILEAIPETDVIVGVGEYDNIANVVAKLIGKPQQESGSAAFLSSSCEAPLPFGNGQENAKRSEQFPDTMQNATESTMQTTSDGASLEIQARVAARKDDITPHIAFVKIAEGCDNHCTYCTIPSIRGPYKSRPMEDIIQEVCALVAVGAKEIVLVAQDTALYGMDIYGEVKLPQLLEKLAAESGATWLRLMYAYPEHITPQLIATMAKLPQVCKYIDMPIQHSEDAIIARMGRRGNKKALRTIIAALRTAMPDIAIRTTLIAGFPGETSRNFESMCNFVRQVGFDRLGVFPYSQEDGTPAAVMQKQVRESTRYARMERLMNIQQDIHFKKQRAFVGQTLAVMVDEVADDGEAVYTGRTQWDAYEVDTVVTFTAAEKLEVGNVYNVRITDSDNYDLRGIYEPA